ncbi:MAG: imidazoleglycerol-phosphate dehydratase HisB [Thermodesulfovibrio sp.]|jgi:imidazoleglycerol-phosphate dehydratase|uniref:imidazoleglycerol-phosphate dehydratase HisB n=1 Tax=unclassified Thermodesulfovibrio TaxID=2645936 RepID=UPI00083A5C88|nr:MULTISPECIES: imidazoleglycerol-phosphate dehydratase HisB [unclassified Thermodesulfovibrio]MDI1471288.1 imidazoleglycerol-phosphate dehydratase HisB [Thermodesulfovibrio sp. 1176]MDI6714707.1 imidazoleglycerol-phosphate dehydratase HisB [Thermodesulfovibrio sp.]ODA44013.1 Imidazoleglycerol-phosphate dehydratase [Thermodesulfovibrio sp. N1]
MRRASLSRKTKETDIKIDFNLDGTGKNDVATSIGFLDHMFELFAFHGGFDIKIEAKGDIHVDFHHLIEDLGIVLGKCIDKALGERKGVKRYSFASIPMDEALAQVSLDLGGRAFLVYNVPFEGYIKDVDINLFEEFFRAVVNNAKITLHVNVPYGKDLHHVIEAIFKAFAKALNEASKIIGENLPSTKGLL